MESSIAKFLWRQPACERLPTKFMQLSLRSLSKLEGCRGSATINEEVYVLFKIVTLDGATLAAITAFTS